jgi:hypothetical protein
MTQREHTPFELLERTLVGRKIPGALGGICSLQRARKPRKRHRQTRSPGKVNHTEDQFDPDTINFLLRDLQTGWLRRFDESK